jgi:hypothetical protein
MDEQLRSELFSIYCFVFDMCVSDSVNLVALYCEFVKFIAHNHTQALAYGPETNLPQLIEVKLREVHQELASRPGNSC